MYVSSCKVWQNTPLNSFIIWVQPAQPRQSTATWHGGSLDGKPRWDSRVWVERNLFPTHLLEPFL